MTWQLRKPTTVRNRMSATLCSGLISVNELIPTRRVRPDKSSKKTVAQEWTAGCQWTSERLALPSKPDSGSLISRW